MRWVLISFSLALVFILSSCHPIATKNTFPRISAHSLEPVKIQLQTDQGLEDSYLGDIDGTDIVIVKTGLKELTMMVPALKPGIYTISFSLGEGEIEILPESTILDSAQLEDVDNAVYELLEFTKGNPGDIEELGSIYENLILLINELPADEKILAKSKIISNVVKMLSANPADSSNKDSSGQV